MYLKVIMNKACPYTIGKNNPVAVGKIALTKPLKYKYGIWYIFINIFI